MNTTLQKRMNSYALAAGCFLCVNQEASGQVVYTDVDPDIILNDGGEAAELDMNNDGVPDFFFHNNSFQYYDTSWLSVRTMKNILVGPDEVGNALAGISNYFNTGYNGFTWYYPFALEQTITINEELTWQDTETQIMALRVFSEDGAVVGSGGYCYWFNFAIPETTDHFLGVRFKDESELSHYGWIRCDVLDEGRTLIIKDFAYETEPEHPIIAGDTVQYVNTEFITPGLNATVYTFNNTIYINLNELIIGFEIHVYDLTGKEVYSDNITNQFTQIELAETRGVYIAELTTTEKKYSKKIFIN